MIFFSFAVLIALNLCGCSENQQMNPSRGNSEGSSGNNGERLAGKQAEEKTKRILPDKNIQENITKATIPPAPAL